MEKKVQKRSLKGVVVSDRMDKTVVVKVTTVKRHAKYNKAYTVSKKYKAHDDANTYVVGDTVMIEASRPYSKDKKWRVVSKVQ